MNHLFPRVLALSSALLAFAYAARASAPSNDDFDNATVIAELPFAETLDTAKATTAADDPSCAGQGATVWYAFTLTTSMFVEVNTFGSDYDTTLSVYTGVRGSLTQVVCNDDTGATLQSQVFFDAQAGTTYFIMVGSFDATPGGHLQFSANVGRARPGGRAEVGNGAIFTDDLGGLSFVLVDLDGDFLRVFLPGDAADFTRETPDGRRHLHVMEERATCQVFLVTGEFFSGGRDLPICGVRRLPCLRAPDTGLPVFLRSGAGDGQRPRGRHGRDRSPIQVLGPLFRHVLG